MKRKTRKVFPLRYESLYSWMIRRPWVKFYTTLTIDQ